MNVEDVAELVRPCDGDPPELAEIRAWLGEQKPAELMALTVVSRIAWLLDHLERNRVAKCNRLALRNALAAAEDALTDAQEAWEELDD